eukprot:m.119190 g.119190  ORF g.119190 m.119190 type:complete len:575 (+) comp15582_c0_seq14:1513-3237(+)
MAPCRCLRVVPQVAGLCCILGFLFLAVGDFSTKETPKGRYSHNLQRAAISTSTTDRSIAQALNAALPSRLQPPSSRYQQPLIWSKNDIQLNLDCFNVPGFECAYLPGPVNLQCCCYEAADKDNVPWYNGQRHFEAIKQNLPVRCMPSYFIIGAQKAGTTALATYMLYHPNVAPMKKKEGHLFDKGLSSLFKTVLPEKAAVYVRQFPALEVTQTQQSITGDATPAYVLSHHYAKAMKQLLPQARLVMILRDPVARAYSEYQMKLRRVEAQKFLDDNELHYRLSTQMEACESNGNRSAAFSCFLKGSAQKEPQFYNHIFKSKPRRTQYMNCVNRKVSKRVARKSTFPRAVQTSSWVRKAPIPLGDLSMSELVAVCLNPKLQRRERVETFEVEVRAEMDKVDASMHRTTSVVKDDIYLDCGEDYAIAPRCLRDVSMSHYFQFDTTVHWPKGSGSNIVRDFVFRGLYLEQIKQYHAIFPPEQLLILTDAELQSAPLATMDQVFHHVGLPPIGFDLDQVSRAQLEQLREAAWPSFNTTGWQMTSIYPPMSPSFEAELREFFAPHTRRLELYLNRSFGWR